MIIEWGLHYWQVIHVLRILVVKVLSVLMCPVDCYLHLLGVLFKFYQLIWSTWFVAEVTDEIWLHLGRGVQVEVLNKIRMPAWICEINNLTTQVIVLFINLYVFSFFCYRIKLRFSIWRSHKRFLRLIFAQKLTNFFWCKIVGINLLNLCFGLLFSNDRKLVRLFLVEVHLVFVN